MQLEKLAATLIAQLRNRVELLAVEWQEEKLRLGGMLLHAVFAAFLLQLAIVLAVLCGVIAFWDSPYKLHGIGLLAFGAMAGAAACWRASRGRSEGRPRPFAGSIAELRKDEQALERPG